MQELTLDPNCARPASAGPGSTRLTEVTDRILRVLAKAAGDNDELGGVDFRRDVADCRAQLASVGSADTVEEAVADSLRVCEAFVTRAHGYLHGVEQELSEVVAVLRLVSTSLSGDSDDFFTSLDRSTARLTQLTQIDDIRQLKREIRVEVENIRHAAEERRQAEQVELERLNSKVAELESNLSQASHEAAHDALTGVANRRTFDRSLVRWLEQAKTAEKPIVVAILDIDDFKQINDTHGHAIGDRVLVCLASLFTDGLRANDLVARYGGEEFAILLRGVTIEKARDRMEQIRGRLAGTYQYEVAGEKITVGFTYSAGLAESVGDDTAEALLARADKALYNAKRRGKNRIVIEKRSRLRRLLGA